ncbi:MAG TPA: hypothetical protein VJ692_05785 [Nitrospiraceae bacterium]|nr:hypothetical protein [Nitrospiraceae bacterium]
MNDPDLQCVRDLRQGLLNLHKTLLESERVAFERFRGRVASSGEFLQLVITDPWFAWLHPLSELVVQIDEALDADDPLTVGDVNDLLGRVQRLLTPSEEGNGFEKHYYDALQRDPDVVLAHAEVAKVFRRGKR